MDSNYKHFDIFTRRYLEFCAQSGNQIADYIVGLSDYSHKIQHDKIMEYHQEEMVHKKIDLAANQEKKEEK